MAIKVNPRVPPSSGYYRYFGKGGQRTGKVRRLEALSDAYYRRVRRAGDEGEDTHHGKRREALRQAHLRRFHHVKRDRNPTRAERIDRAWRRSRGLLQAARRRHRVGRMYGGIQHAHVRASRVHEARRVSNPRRKRNPKRKARVMAKRTAAQRRAFRKMLAGLRRYKASKSRRSRKRRSRPSRARRTVSVRVNPRKKRGHMARRRVRRRRARATIMVNPRRRRHRRRNPGRFRVRHRRHHHRRRNPGMVGGIVKTLFPAALVGGVVGAVEAKFLTGVSEPIRIGGKLALGVLAMLFLRKRPMAAAVVGSSVFATLGYEGGVRAAGGVVAGSASAAAPQLKALIREDPRAMSALVRSFRGMGVLAVDDRIRLQGNELNTSALPPGTYAQGVSLQ